MAIGEIRNGINTARQTHELLRANEANLRRFGGKALDAAAGVRHNGLSETAGEVRKNITPERASLLVRMARKLGGAALNGAGYETGVINKKGKFSAWGATKAALGMKTGNTQARAIKGAFNGAREAFSVDELRTEWANTGPASAPANSGNRNPFSPNQTSYDANPLAANAAPEAHPFNVPSPHYNEQPPLWGNNQNVAPAGGNYGYNAPPQQYAPNPFAPSPNRGSMNEPSPFPPSNSGYNVPPSSSHPPRQYPANGYNPFART